jgi:3-oxoacyl-[acyl-carrier-protein] synthase III
METTIGIKSIVSCFPSTTININQLPNYNQLPAGHKTLFDSCGITQVHTDDETHFTTDLTLQAAQKLCTKNKLFPEKIDVIIHLQARSPDFLTSSTATKIQHELKAHNAICFTLSDLGCVDIATAVMLANNLLCANKKYKNIIITYCSRPIAQDRFRYPVTIIGDGAMALLITSGAKNKIIDYALEVNGKYWNLFYTDYKNQQTQNWQEKCRDIYEYSFGLAIESKNRFAAINEKLLKKNKLSYDKINHFIMQNISLGAFRFYEDLLKIKFAPVCYKNLKNYGHLGPMDIILNLNSGIEAGLFKKGELLLLMDNSPVAAWGSMLIKI